MILTVVNIRGKSILIPKLNPTEKACPAFEGGRGVVRHESLLAKVPVQQQIGTERGPDCLPAFLCRLECREGGRGPRPMKMEGEEVEEGEEGEDIPGCPA